jgi:hypothetical protein
MNKSWKINKVVPNLVKGECAGYLGYPFAKSVVFSERMSQVASTPGPRRSSPVGLAHGWGSWNPTFRTPSVALYEHVCLQHTQKTRIQASNFPGVYPGPDGIPITQLTPLPCPDQSAPRVHLYPPPDYTPLVMPP